MNIKMIKGLRRAAALALAVILAVPTVFASAGEARLQTATDIVEGLTYSNTITEHASGRVESFALELEAGRGIYPILRQGSGTVYGLATINRAVTDAQEAGLQVLGAINTDYFSTSTGVPMGIVIEDGVYKSCSDGRPALTITDGELAFMEKPAVSLTLTNERDGSVLIPNHFNKWRSATGGTYLLNGDFSTVSTRTSTPGWYVRMKVVGEEGSELPELTVNSTLTLEVTELLQTDQPAAIPEGEYVLTADDLSGRQADFASFQVGDRITLTTTCEDEVLSAAQWACGVGDLMIAEGELTDSASWAHVTEGRAPRTALGVKEDGTLLLYAVDGRQSGYSTGLTQKDLAQELLDRGCEWAVNLDGGGSTAMSVWLPGQSGPALQNSPSDGKARSCATYLLLVSEDAGSGRADRLAMTRDGLTVLAGSDIALPETVVVDDGLNVLNETIPDLTITSRKGLGDVAEGIYTAGDRPGTDTLRLRSRSLGLEGTAQIHVVDHLTELKVFREGSTVAAQTLSVEPGESVQLAVSGSYWGREALRDFSAVTWTVEGNVGTVDEDGLFTASEEGGEGSITARAGGMSQTIRVTMRNIHRDVTEEHWAYNAVAYCYEKGIVGGISATEFGRDHQIRRADFMLMLYNAVGKPKVETACNFTDVSPSDYYYTALSWGQNVGLASGTGNGAYLPTAPITREQAFTILRQAMPLLGKECPTGSLTVLEQFSDRDQIADYARGHTATLVAQGVVSGKGDGIDPKGNLTRAEMAALLYKIITYTPILNEPEVPVVPEVPAEPEAPAEPEIPVLPELPDPEGYTLTMKEGEITLACGGSYQLTTLLEPAWEGAEITWTSANSSIATVNRNGAVTNLSTAAGEARVTVTAQWNGKSASCTVVCLPAQRVGVVHDAELGLNVRSGPGSDYAVIGGLTDEMRVVVLGEMEGWYQILYRNREDQAAIGYVSADYVRLDG